MLSLKFINAANCFKNKYFVVIASTDVSTCSGPDNSLHEHSWKAHSMSPVNLAEIQILEASVYDLSFIQIHGK